MAGFGLALALYAAAGVPAVAAFGRTQDAPALDIVATRPDAADRMTVPVQIAGRGPYHFVIDTGSQRTVLSTRLAALLQLTPTERMRVISVSGAQIVDAVVLDELGLGRRSFHGLTVLLLEGEHIGADGIVGLDSLQNQRLLIDFASNSMAVGDAKKLGGNAGFEIVVTARRRSGQLIMTRATIDGVRTDIVIDTGSDTSIGNRALQRAMRRRNELRQAELLSVTGQTTIADMDQAGRLTIGAIGIDNVVIAYADTPAFAALELEHKPALLLGMRELRLFKRVAIDFSTRKVMFDLPPG